MENYVKGVDPFLELSGGGVVLASLVIWGSNPPIDHNGGGAQST